MKNKKDMKIVMMKKGKFSLMKMLSKEKRILDFMGNNWTNKRCNLMSMRGCPKMTLTLKDNSKISLKRRVRMMKMRKPSKIISITFVRSNSRTSK